MVPLVRPETPSEAPPAYRQRTTVRRLLFAARRVNREEVEEAGIRGCVRSQRLHRIGSLEGRGDALYAASLQELDELEENRALRLLAAREGIPSILWVVLVVGGTLTIAFTFLFGMERAWLHAVAVAGLTTAVCLILYVIAILDYPFNSGVSVQPDAFELVLHVIQG